MKNREIAFKDLAKQKNFQIQKFTEAFSDEWDKFVWSSNNGTIFHTRKFLSYHPKERFVDSSLIIKKDQKWIALLPAVSKKDRMGKCLISHAGASVGGPVVTSALSFRDTFRLVDTLVEHAKKNSFVSISMTLPPQIYYCRPSNYLDFALLDLGFTYLKREVSSVIPLDFAEEDTLLIFSPESRRAVRKAIKMEVEVAECQDYFTFYNILKRNLKLRHNVQPTHTLDELILLKTIFPERIKLFTASLQNKIIAGIVLFICNTKVALAFYISHDEEMQMYRGVNMLFYEVIRWTIRKKLKFLDFGIFTLNMKPNWGLAKFKESFGAQGIFRETFVKVLE